VVDGLTARLVLLAAAAATLALAGSAAAATSGKHPHHVRVAHVRHPRLPGGVIVPQRGISGATLGMSQSRVRSVLGVPYKVRRANNAFGRYSVYRYKGLSIIFQGNFKATTIATHSKRQKTVSGVGVGSTWTQVVAGVPHVHCKLLLGFRHCTLGTQTPGKRVTDFILKNHLVVRVVIGFVLD
jgi:hypothetical protein